MFLNIDTAFRGMHKEWLLIPLYALCSLAMSGCTDAGLEEDTGDRPVKIMIRTPHSGPGLKSEDPDENLVTDMNIFIFDANGIMEADIYMPVEKMHKTVDGYSFDISLLRGCRYSVYAFANAGYNIDVSSLEELHSFRYYLVYPDDYRIGMPMSGRTENFTIPASGEVPVAMERLMAKVSLSIDRSRLNEGIDFHVRRVKVGACPRTTCLFGQNTISDEEDLFAIGFTREDTGVAALNKDTGFGKSGETSVYMLENMHGDLMDSDIPDTDKAFAESDPLARLCSYIEIEVDYISDEYFSLPGKSLTYRFYIGEDNGNFDVKRNRHYHICVTPENDGLGEDSWNVDMDGLGKYIRSISLNADSIEMNYYGETFVLEAHIEPEDAASQTLVWESDNGAVAEVSQAGTVTAVGEGTCTIRCRASDGGDIYAECTVSCRFSPSYLKIYPGTFIRGRPGDEIHLTCEYFPPNAPFQIGVEELEYDKERGIYDYVLDDDGKGVQLFLRNNGSGMLYIEAGYPINQSEVVVVVVD